MAGQRKALIVANDRYEQEGLQNLRAPAADAAGLRRVLGDPHIGAFAVQVVRNEPAHVIHAEIEELFLESRPDDVLLLHFSCHGLKSESGELFFAAANTRPDRLGSTAVSGEFVDRCMKASRSRSIVLLLDCCYGGAFTQGVTVRASGDVNVLESFPRESTGGGRSRAIITASGAMEYAFEGTRLADDHRRRRQPSAFTAALIEGLGTGDADRDQDGWVSLDELYDYVFDKVREQNPHQTPNRRLDLSGELYVFRSPRGAPGQRPPGPGQETTASRPNVSASPATGNRPSAAAGGYDAPGQPPGGPDSWRQEIDTSRPARVGLMSGPGHAFVLPAGLIAVLALAGWAVNAAWLAWTQEPTGWLAAAAAVGFYSLVGVGLRRATRARLYPALSAVLCIVIYIVSAFASTENWVVRGWLGGTLILYGIVAAAMATWTWEARQNGEAKVLRERELRVAEAMQRTRWLTDTEPDPAVSALLDPLGDIPAARFAIVPEGPIQFLAVAGKKITLGAFADWPTGEYTRLSSITGKICRDGQVFPAAAAELARIDADAQKWLALFQGIYEVSINVVVIIRPQPPAHAGKLVLRFSEYDKMNIGTLDTFADTAGPFLADDAYTLNPQILERLHSRLNAGGLDDSAAPIAAVHTASAPPTDGGATPGTHIFSSDESGLTHSDETAMPEVSQLDSVTADALRYAASLRHLGEGLDTCTVLLAVAQVHVRGRWDRIWLNCARSPEDIAAARGQSAMQDPADHPRESWNGIQLTATCAKALQTAARIGSRHNLPIAPGVLVLGLLADPSTAAAKALGVGVTIEHDELLHLIEDDLLDVSGIHDTN